MVVYYHGLEGVLGYLGRFKNSEVVCVNYYEQSTVAAFFKPVNTVNEDVFIFVKLKQLFGTGNKAFACGVGNYFYVSSQIHSKTCHAYARSYRVKVGVAVSHNYDVGCVRYFRVKLVSYYSRVNSGTLLLTLGESAEVIYALFILDYHLISASLKRKVERGKRISLSLRQSRSRYRDTHRYRYGDTVVTNSDLAHVVQNAELVFDTESKLLSVKNKDILISVVFTENAVHFFGESLEDILYLRCLSAVASLDVLSYLLKVIYQYIGDSGGLGISEVCDLGELCDVVEDEHIINVTV